MMAFGAKIKLSVATTGAAKFRKEIQDRVDTATGKTPIVLKNVQLKVSNPATQIASIQKQFNDKGIVVKLKEVNAKGAITKLRSDIQDMLKGLNIVGLKEFLGADSVEDAARGIQQAKDATGEWAAQLKVVETIQQKLSSTYKTALSGTGKGMVINDSAQMESITASYTEWQKKVEELRNTRVALSDDEITAIQNEGIAIQQNISLVQTGQKEKIDLIKAEEKEKIRATKEIEVASKAAAKAEESAAKSQVTLSQQSISLKSQIYGWTVSNSKAYRQHKVEIDEMLSSLNSGSDLSSEKLKKVNNRFVEISDSTKLAGKTGSSFFETFKKGLAKFGGWALVTRSLMLAYGVVKDMIVAVKELDAAMIKLRKVTDLSEVSYKNYINTAITLSQAIGATLADTISATADFARLGYNIADSTSLAEAALVYKNVGDGIRDVSEASESLISTIKAFESFGVSANDAMNIVDMFNEVGNNFAISSQGIGVALQKSASALASANNSLEESIALVTAMNAVIQNPEIVGTVAKTLSMYLRAAKTEAEEAGESTAGMANSVSELREELLALTDSKVDIMIDESTFKSTYQIMKELSQVWGELSDIDSANILELIGGKRNAAAVTSLLTNFKDAEAALKTALNATGSAAIENEKYLSGIEGKLDVLQAKFEAISYSLIDSNFVKGLLDVSTVLLSIIEQLSQISFIVPLILVAVGALNFKNQIKEMGQLAQRVLLQKNAILSEKVATDQLSISITSLSVAQKELFVTELQKLVISKKITGAEYEQIIATLGLTTANTGLTVANTGLAASFKSLMASIPIWGWIALGISLVIELTAVISSAVKGIETSAVKLKRLSDEFEQLISSIKDVSDGYKDLKETADAIIPRFAELATGVGKFGENVSLTNEEYKEFTELNNKIAALFPELNLGMDSNGNAMLSLSYNADNLTESLWKLVEAQQQMANQQIADTMPDALKKIGDIGVEYEKQIKDAYKKRGEWESTYNSIINQTLVEGLGTFYSIEKGMAAAEDAIKRAKALGVDSEIIYNPDLSRGSSGYVFTIKWDYENVDLENLDDLYEAKLQEHEKLINNYQLGIERQWKQLDPIISAWMQTDTLFSGLNNQMKQIAMAMVSGIDFKGLGLETEAQIQAYVANSVLHPLYLASDDVKDAFNSITDFRELAKIGEMSSDEFADKITKTFNTLVESMDVKSVSAFKGVFVNAFKDMSKEGDSFENVVQGIAKAWSTMPTATSYSSVATIISEFRDVIAVLKEVSAEQENTGTVSVETYNKVIALGEDYASLFDFTNGKIELQTDKLVTLIQSLLNEEAARLASNGATEEQIALLTTLSKGIKRSENSYSSLISKIETLYDILKKVNDGYEYSSLEILNLIQQHPELAIGIQATTNGYKLQEEAVVSLIKKNALLIEQQKTIAMQSATDSFMGFGGNSSSVANIDSIFASYKAQYGDAISTWDEFVVGWQDYWQRSAEGVNWVEGVKDYVEAVINETHVTEWTDKIVSDLQNGIIKPGSSSSSSSGSSEPQWLKDFKFAVTMQQHLVSVAVTTQQEYIDWLDSAYKKAFANDTTGKYITDMWKYEEEVFKFRTEAAQKSIDTYLDYAKRLYDVHQDEAKYINDITWALNRYDEALSDSQRESILKNIEDSEVEHFKNIIRDLNHQADILARTEKDGGVERIQNYQKIQETLLEWQKYYLDKGYDINSTQLQDLESEYNSYADKITNIVKDAYEKMIEAQRESLEEMIKAIEEEEDALDSVLDAVVDHIKRRKQAEIESLQDIISQHKEYYDNLIDETTQYYKDVTNSAKESYNSQKDEMTEYYDSLISSVKNAATEQADALKAELEAYKKIIDAKKESLQATRDEDKYNQNVADKNKNISSLQRQIDILQLDSSSSARAERLRLEEELSGAIRELNEYQTDYSLDLQLKALDDEYNRYQEVIDDKTSLIEDEADAVIASHEKQKESYLENLEIQNEAYFKNLERQQEAAIQAIEYERDSKIESLNHQIAEIEEYLKKEGNLRRDANALLLEEGEALWTELMAYEYEYSKSITELENAWEVANGAMNKYNNSQLNVLSTLGTMINMLREYNAQLASIDSYNSIVNQMKANSQAWTSATPEQQDYLHQQNQHLASQAGLTYNPADGHWYKNGQIAYTIYHSGADRGFVQADKYTPLKSHETFAKLARGELVLNPPQIDNVMGGFQKLLSNIPTVTAPNYAIDNLVGINVGNVNEASIKDIGKIAKEAALGAFKMMQEPLKRKGVGVSARNLSI